MAAGSIVLELLMKTGSFETDTKRAEKRLRELEKQAAAFGAAIGGVAVAGLTAFAYAASQTVNALDEIGEAAQRIGVTTEALSGLQYAAQLSAVSAEELESGMIKLSKAAADGNDAFAAMGVSVTDAHGGLKTADVLLGEVAAQFANYKDGAEKTALALEIFGKAGAKLIPLLNAGADGIAQMNAEAAQMGLIVGGDAAQAASDLNDNLDRMQAVVTGSLRQGVSDLIPLMVTISEYMLDAAKSGGILTSISEGVKIVFQTVAVVGSDVAFVFKSVGKELAAMSAAFSQLVQGNLTAAREIKKAVRAEGEESRKELDAFQAKIMGVQNAMSAVGRVGGASADDLGKKIAAPVVVAATRVKTARARIDKDAQAALRAQEQLAEEGKRLAESLQTPGEKLAASQGRAGELRGAGVISSETQARANQAALDEYQKYVDGQRDLLTRGLLSEEEEIRTSYERRRAEILAITEATETEKQDALLRLEEQYDKQRHDAHLSRYRDLMSQEAAITEEYKNRREAILNDSTLTAEQRAEYLGNLQRKWSEEMNALDEADAKKKREAQKKQIDLVSGGFGEAASLAKAFVGENSKTYAAMFAMSKASALADLAIEESKAIARAWGENNYFVAAGLTVGLAAQFAGLYASVQGASFGGTRADGGSVSPDRSYLVGERGPERFVPTQPGVILPNDAQSNAAGGGGNIRIVNAYDSSHVAEFMGSGEGERVIMNAVRRNGAALRQMVRTS